MNILKGIIGHKVHTNARIARIQGSDGVLYER